MGGDPSKESIEVVVKLEIFGGKNYFEEISKTVKCNFPLMIKILHSYWPFRR